ncbi:hypothetical protein [Rhizobium leguminosarum]|uniref:hypothetical protein n=1 Tax=Rhizobium leguminosarum TaxID=384 RepID=UPI0004245965|nr:hypothetical protein [Rhizobium leguminosarum]
MQQSKGFEDIVAQIEYEFGVSGVDSSLSKFAESWEQCRTNIQRLGSAIEDMGALGTTCGPSLSITVLIGDAMVEALRQAERRQNQTSAHGGAK